MPSALPATLLALLLAGCDDGGPVGGEPDLSGCTCPHGADRDGGDPCTTECTPAYPDRCTDCDCDGFTEADGDCDDHDYLRHPGAPEGACGPEYCRDDVSDGVDNDCNGWVDEGTTPLVEVCNGADDDCDGAIDEDVLSTWYGDGDGDGFGDPEVSLEACEEPLGHTADGTDCDDGDPAVHPGATEACDGVDDDCDGEVDEAGASGCVTFLQDRDEDGYGTETSLCLCAPEGAFTATEGGDCDDRDPAVHPGAEEICNDGIDNDCDGGPGPCVLDSDIGLADADATFVGEGSPSDAGRAVGTGDVDGDGVGDVLVGAYGTDTTGHTTGAVYVVSGPAWGTVPLADADARLAGLEEGDWTGSALASADVDADGIGDLLVGAPNYGETSSGTVYVVRGPVSGPTDLTDADARWIGASTGEGAGTAIVMGDLTGDGLDEIVVGAACASIAGLYSGAVYVVPGHATGVMSLARADARWIGGHEDDGAGGALATGDTDGDGVDDVLVGACAEDSSARNAGAVYLVLGPSSGMMELADADAKLVGEAASDFAGGSIAMGDVDGDGLDDLLIGAGRHSEGATHCGIAYLVLGSVRGTRSLSLADARFVGATSDDYAGLSVAVGDVDGDGFDDVLVGAYLEDSGGSDAGAAYLAYGPASGWIELSGADTRFMGVDADDWAGISIGAGDVDDDGIEDVLVGARQADPDGRSVGAAYLVYGVGM